MENTENKKLLAIEIKGKDPVLWQQLREKFIIAINRSLDTIINAEHNASIRDEAKEFASALIDHAKSKLKKAGIENEKLIADVDRLFVQREKQMAEARKINAEAKAIELKNTIKELKLSLGAMKVLMVGEMGEEDLIFTIQIEEFLHSLKSLED